GANGGAGAEPGAGGSEGNRPSHSGAGAGGGAHGRRGRNRSHRRPVNRGDETRNPGGRDRSREAVGARLGLGSLCLFGVGVPSGLAGSLWIRSLLPSEGALPIMGLLAVGVLGISAMGVISALVALGLSRARWWLAATGLIANGAPWIYLLWLGF